MIKKTFQNFVLLLFLSSCGYEALYSVRNDPLNIKVLSYEGDTSINSKLIQKLKRYQNSNYELNEINIKTEYLKKDSSKNSAGKVENYELIATTEFNVTKSDLNQTIIISENFVMKNFDDEFEELNYENTIKENISNSMVQKLIIQLSRIE